MLTLSLHTLLRRCRLFFARLLRLPPYAVFMLSPRLIIAIFFASYFSPATFRVIIDLPPLSIIRRYAADTMPATMPPPMPETRRVARR